jgi:hypothetical protein
MEADISASAMARVSTALDSTAAAADIIDL